VRWDGIRILDLTQVQAGPSCTQLLASLGGEVIEIEEPGVGYRTRKELAHDPDSDSFYFLVFNANKKSVCLNLESEDGVRKFKELARTVDVVVENFGPGGLERFDLEYEQGDGPQSKDNLCLYQRLRYLWPVHRAQGIRDHSTGDEHEQRVGSQSVIISAGISDSGSGLLCAIDILAALRQRGKTGVGDYVDVSMQDAAVNLMRIRMIETLSTREPQPREGNRWWDFPPLVYQCHPGGLTTTW